MKIVRSFVCAMAVILAPLYAQAGTIVLDWQTAGDGLLLSDDATGLEWLNLTVTAGASRSDTIARLTTDLAGWRLATAPEVSGLIEVNAGVTFPSSEVIPAGGSLYNSIYGFVSLLGPIENFSGGDFISYGTAGFYADNGVGSDQILQLRLYGFSDHSWTAYSAGSGGILKGSAAPEFGTWLVRDAATAVPDSTSTLELVIIVGLLGFVVQRWRPESA